MILDMSDGKLKADQFLGLYPLFSTMFSRMHARSVTEWLQSLCSRAAGASFRTAELDMGVASDLEPPAVYRGD